MSADPRRVTRTDIHLCKWCGKVFQPGDDVVSLSDGTVNPDEEYDVRSRRFWHRECWIEDIHGQYQDSENDTKTDVSAGGGDGQE